MTDAEIINLYWDRDQSAITQSASQYGGYCYSIANSILNNNEDSEECLNDTWLRAWKAIPPQRPNRLSLFLGRVTRNLAFDKYKMSKAQKRNGGEFQMVLNELDDCIPSSASVEQAVADNELEQLINDYLHTLPERECNIFMLRYWYNEPIAEIGKLLSIKGNNVKASLFRSRKNLKAFLEKEGVTL